MEKLKGLAEVDSNRHGWRGLRKTKVGEFLAQGFDEFGADLVLFVVFFEVVTFLDAGVTADGGDVDHAVSLKR